MFQNSTTVLRIAGIEIKIAASWFLIAALITWSLADQVFPTLLEGLSNTQYLLLGVTSMVLFFVSLLLHELAHAMVAMALGIEVPRITLFLFGGVAEMGDEPSTPAHEFLIALAGPAMSFALAAAFWFCTGVASLLSPAAAAVLGYLATINAFLAVFNLLPAFPLDGGRVLRAALWAHSGDVLKATERSAQMGWFLGLALMGIGVLSLFQGLQLSGAWQILIGTFILFAARSAVEAQRAKTFLGAQCVGDLMSTPAFVTAPDISLSNLVNRVMLPNRISFVPVVENGQLLGHIDTEVLSMIDRENWSNTQVGDVFVALDGERSISPRTLAFDLLRQISETGCRKFFVVEDGRLDGVITLSDLIRVLQIMTALHGEPPRGTRIKPA